MEGESDQPHSKYLHVYAIVRFDLFISSGEHNATVVKVFPSQALAEREAARLREINREKECINAVQTTRLIGAPLIAET
jgi:hypothetical protein